MKLNAYLMCVVYSVYSFYSLHYVHYNQKLYTTLKQRINTHKIDFMFTTI